MANIDGYDVLITDTPNEGRVKWNTADQIINSGLEEHEDASDEVHGLGAGEDVVGTSTEQELTNKTIDIEQNTFENWPDSLTTLTFSTDDETVSAAGSVTMSGMNGIEVLGDDSEDSIAFGLEEALIINHSDGSQTVTIKTDTLAAGDTLTVGGQTSILDNLNVYNATATLEVGVSTSECLSFTKNALAATDGLGITSTDSITFNTNDLVIDPASSRVGIGTASPSVTLDVAGQANVGGSSAYLNINSAAVTSAGTATNFILDTINVSDSMLFKVGGTLQLTLTSTTATFEQDVVLDENILLSTQNNQQFAYYGQGSSNVIELEFESDGTLDIQTGTGGSAPTSALEISATSITANKTFIAETLGGTLGNIETFYNIFDSSWSTYSAGDIEIATGLGSGTRVLTTADLGGSENIPEIQSLTLTGTPYQIVVNPDSPFYLDREDPVEVEFRLPEEVHVEDRVIIGTTSITGGWVGDQYHFEQEIHGDSYMRSIYLGEPYSSANTNNLNANVHLDFYTDPTVSDTNCGAKFAFNDPNNDEYEKEFTLDMRGDDADTVKNGFTIRKNGGTDNTSIFGHFYWNNGGRLSVNKQWPQYTLDIAGDGYVQTNLTIGDTLTTVNELVQGRSIINRLDVPPNTTNPNGYEYFSFSHGSHTGLFDEGSLELSLIHEDGWFLPHSAFGPSGGFQTVGSVQAITGYVSGEYGLRGIGATYTAQSNVTAEHGNHSVVTALGSTGSITMGNDIYFSNGYHYVLLTINDLRNADYTIPVEANFKYLSSLKIDCYYDVMNSFYNGPAANVVWFFTDDSGSNPHDYNTLSWADKENADRILVMIGHPETEYIENAQVRISWTAEWRSDYGSGA